MKKLLLIPLLIAISLLNSGCTSFEDYYVSKADYCSNCEQWDNGVVVINSKDAKIALRLDNRVCFKDGLWVVFLPIVLDSGANANIRSSDAEKVFSIELGIKANSENLTFDPREIYVRLDTGQYVQASRYYGHGPIEEPNPDGAFEGIVSSDKYADVSEPGIFKINQKPLSETNQYFGLPKQEWVGFYVYFDIPTPNPGTQLSIIVKGLKKRTGEDVPIEEITFKDKVKYRHL